MSQSNEERNGWSRAEMFVLEAIERIETKVDAMDDKLTSLRIDVARKGAIWGAVSGTVIAVIGALLRK